MELRNAEMPEILIGGYLITRYSLGGTVVAKITKKHIDEFGTKNGLMGIQGDFGIEDVIIHLPEEVQEFKTNLDVLIYEVDGVYVPESKKNLLPSLSENQNYKRSLEGLEKPHQVMTKSKLEQIASE
ncbi:MAG TPA: hypothetical protein VJB94_03585 [Candidatus Nanoarchaeia archaeon]|nr:hypothetical protein [Candidatus Nanoarchaeia archaeon]